jgi:hypothetical protein
MPDDLGDRGPRDRSRVNVYEDWEVSWWCDKWGCTREELKDAVDAVGVMALDVEAWLRAHR